MTAVANGTADLAGVRQRFRQIAVTHPPVERRGSPTQFINELSRGLPLRLAAELALRDGATGSSDRN